MTAIYGFLIICAFAFGVPAIATVFIFWHLGRKRKAVLLPKPALITLSLPCHDPDRAEWPTIVLRPEPSPAHDRPEHDDMEPVTPEQIAAALARIEAKANSTITFTITNK